jgi:hypothetical protein
MSRYQKQGDFNYHFSNMPYTIWIHLVY